MRLAALVIVLASSCGRIGFGPLGDAAISDAPVDGTTADAPAVRSCVGLAATCGPNGTTPCCDSIVVPGGTFYRSYDAGSDGLYSVMNYPATLTDFRLDTYEVTVGRFRQFVEAGMGTQASPPADGAGARTLGGMPGQGGWNPAWNTQLQATTAALTAALECNATYQSWTNAPGANESKPIECITWYEAFAFCAWDGGFLPTEAQLNYAAAGGDQQRAYPWSTPPSSLAIDCSHANYTTACANAVNRVGTDSPGGDGRWGHADLAGNVYEWTLDTFDVYTNPCDDCADFTTTGGSVLLGGSFDSVATSARTGARPTDNPGVRNYDNGIRCARLP